jgi:hypothetical protein
MKNSDFRAMLQAAQQRAPVTVAESPAPGSEEKPKAKKERKFYKPKAEKAEKAAPAYRDRAAERREAKDEEVKEFATVPVTATKFLGGDEQHTHLVKGLDVALLEKVRAEQAAAANKKLLLEEFGSDSESGEVVDKEVETLGTRLLALLEEKPASAASRTALALFAPGRMAYLFDLEQPQDVPTMELRALGASTKAASKRSMAAVPQPLIEEVANILAYGAAGKGRTRAKPVADVGATSPVAVAGATQVTLLASKKRPIVDEEKIFSESSDEEGEALKKQKTSELEEAPVVAKGSYFGETKAEQKTADPLAAVLGISVSKVEAAARALEKQKKAEKRREEKQLEMTRAAAERASAAGGAYGSYLQRTVAAGVVVAGKQGDPDEEEEGKKSRFIVEEDDEVDDEAILRRYRETLEGVGEEEEGKNKGKGRKKGRGKKGGAEDAEADKKKHKKNHDKMKTNQELEKIERLMKDKKKE